MNKFDALICSVCMDAVEKIHTLITQIQKGDREYFQPIQNAILKSEDDKKFNQLEIMKEEKCEDMSGFCKIQISSISSEPKCADTPTEHFDSLESLSHSRKSKRLKVRKFCCDFCCSKFYCKAKLRNHIKQHAEKAIKLNETKHHFEEKKPDSTVANIDSFKSKSWRKRRLKCSMCFKIFMQQNLLNTHIKVVHKKIRN